jgi:hypothetical protein
VFSIGESRVFPSLSTLPQSYAILQRARGGMGARQG